MRDELLKIKQYIEKTLDMKERINVDQTSDKYMTILVTHTGNETIFKIDRNINSKNIQDYSVKDGLLFYKGTVLTNCEKTTIESKNKVISVEWIDVDDAEDFF